MDKLVHETVRPPLLTGHEAVNWAYKTLNNSTSPEYKSHMAFVDLRIWSRLQTTISLSGCLQLVRVLRSLDTAQEHLLQSTISERLQPAWRLPSRSPEQCRTIGNTLQAIVDAVRLTCCQSFVRTLRRVKACLLPASRYAS